MDIKEIKDNNGIIVADHPFYYEGLGKYLEKNPEILKDFDALEVFNGEASFGLPIGPINNISNYETMAFYMEVKEKYKQLGALSNSDAHSEREIGKSWTEIDFPDIINAVNFVNSLRESIGRTNLQTRMQMDRKTGITGAIDHIIDITLLGKLRSKNRK